MDTSAKDTQPNLAGGMPYEHLEDLLKQNVELAKENNRILKRMQRNSIFLFVVHVIIWLVVLGVPLYFLSVYLGPLLSALTPSHTSSTTLPNGLVGLPSTSELKTIIQNYVSKQAQ